MSIVQFLRILWARRVITIMATVSCLIGAFIVTQILPPRYQAYSRVMMDMVKPDPVTGQTTSPNFARAYTKTQIELIQDYRVAGNVIDKLGWMNDPNMMAAYEARPAGDDRDFRRWSAQRIIDGTNAKLIDASNILEITYTASSPETARAVADAIREAYIDTSLQFRRDSARRTGDWYTAQAIKAKNVLDDLRARERRYFAGQQNGYRERSAIGLSGCIKRTYDGSHYAVGAIGGEHATRAGGCEYRSSLPYSGPQSP